MESYGSLPVGKRTRRTEAEMYRKLHEDFKRNYLQKGSELAYLETCRKKVNLGKEGSNIGRNVLGNNLDDALSGREKGNMASKVRSKKAGVRKRGNVLGQAKKKSSALPKGKPSNLKSAERKSRGVSGNGGTARRSRSRSRLQCDKREDDFVFEGEREVGNRDTDEREVIIIGDEDDGEGEEGDGASREQRSGGVSGVGGVARRTRSRCQFQFNDIQSNTVYAEERKEGEGGAGRNEFIDIDDDEDGKDDKVDELNVEEEEEKKDGAYSEDDNDDMKDDNYYVVNDNEEGQSDDEEVDDVVAYDSSDVDMVSGVGGVAKRTRSMCRSQFKDIQSNTVYAEERKEGEDDVERNEFIDIGDVEDVKDEKVEELNVDEEVEEKDEAWSEDDDDDMKEDNDYVVNDNEEGHSDDEVDDVAAFNSSDVDMDEPETSLSSKDGHSESYKDGGEQNSVNSDVIGQDSKLEEQEDKEVDGNKPVDPVDIGNRKFLESNVEKHGFVAMRTRSHSNLAPLQKKVSPRSMESSDGEGDFGAGKCQVNDGTVRNSFGGKSDDAGKKKVKHRTISNPKKRKRRCNVLKDHEVEKILVASILKKGNENLPYEEVTQLRSKPTLLWKFTFGIEESSSHHKELKEDKEILQLWDEMALSLSQNDVNSDQIEENKPETCNDVGDTTFCSQGNHLFVLDEEIGVVCRRCSFVRLEIRYYAPPMSKYPWGRSERREHFRNLNKFPDDFRYEDLEFNSESGLSSFPDLHGTVWNLVPGVRRGMHAHQVEGFEFLWKNIAGGIHLDDLKDPETLQGGSGCVISHAPGTGKTRLTIAFLQTYMKLYPTCKPIIIAPTSMLQTWESEFLKWQVEVPFLNLNDPKLIGNEHKSALKLLGPGNHSSHLIRLIKLFSWKLDGGVLALSYKLFVELTSRLPTEHGSAWKSLLDLPGLLILDEGHTPRNDNSIMWKALSKIKTWRKIILSGTPFQNNFDELFNIFCLIRPKFVDKKICGLSNARRGRESRARAKWALLTSQIEQSDDDRLNKERFKRIWQEIAPFVHVHKGSILQQQLPGLKDSLVFLEPLDMQKDLLNMIDESLADRSFNWEQAVTLVCVHPSLLCSKLHIPSLELVDRRTLESVKLDPEAGAKTKFVMELIRLCDLVGEKVLVFSQLIPPLNMMIKLLEAELDWMEGREILFVHGQTEPDRRQTSIRDFNDPRSASKIMLASIKAFSEGISLVGASRVVMLDVGWNPSVERQAICRAYRLGQEKVVHVYRLLASGTMEEDKYRRQSAKSRCSEQLFQSADPFDRNRKMPSTLADDKDKLMEQMVEGEKLKHIIKNVTSIDSTG